MYIIHNRLHEHVVKLGCFLRFNWLIKSLNSGQLSKIQYFFCHLLVYSKGALLKVRQTQKLIQKWKKNNKQREGSPTTPPTLPPLLYPLSRISPSP